MNINLQNLIETAQKLTDTKSKQQSTQAHQALFLGFHHVAQDGLEAVLIHGLVKQNLGEGTKRKRVGDFGHSAWGHMWCPMVF